MIRQNMINYILFNMRNDVIDADAENLRYTEIKNSKKLKMFEWILQLKYKGKVPIVKEHYNLVTTFLPFLKKNIFEEYIDETLSVDDEEYFILFIAALKIFRCYNEEEQYNNEFITNLLTNIINNLTTSRSCGFSARTLKKTNITESELEEVTTNFEVYSDVKYNNKYTLQDVRKEKINNLEKK